MALEKQFKGTRITKKVAPPPYTVVDTRRQCASRLTITLSKTCSANPYRHPKRRVGRLLQGTHLNDDLVPARKQVTHKLSGAEGSLSGSKRVPRPLIEQYNSHSYSGCLYKHGMG